MQMAPRLACFLLVPLVEGARRAREAEHALMASPAHEALDPLIMRTCVQTYTSNLTSLGSGLDSAEGGEEFQLQTHATALHEAWAKKIDRLSRRSDDVVTPRSAPISVIGAGFGTTGTSSLAAALSAFNLTVFHANAAFASSNDSKVYTPDGQLLDPYAYRSPIMKAWQERSCFEMLDAHDYTLPRGLNAWLDRPVAESFVDILLANTDAKVVLTTRPVADWVVERGKYNVQIPIERPCYAPRRIGTRNMELVGRLVLLHNELVRCLVPPSRLLEIDVFGGASGSASGAADAMRRLGELLGMAAPPHEAYPKMSASELTRLPTMYIRGYAGFPF